MPLSFQKYAAAIATLYAEQDAKLHLRPGASETTLAAAEQKLGFALDRSLRAAWRHANGGREWETLFTRPDYYTGYRFLSVTEALAARAGMKRRAPAYADYVEPQQRDPKLQAGWYQEGWLPFASFGGATLLLIQDYSPGRAGKRGQIIAFTHDPDEMSYVAPSFSALLAASLEFIRDDPEEFIEASD